MTRYRGGKARRGNNQRRNQRRRESSGHARHVGRNSGQRARIRNDRDQV